MISLLLIYIILLSGSIFLSLKFNKKIENTFIVWIMSIIFILYFCGLFKLLEMGVYLILLISIMLLIYDINKFLDDKSIFKKLIFTKGLFFFTLLFIGLIIIHKDRLISVWDEFSHWGDVVKAMFYINDFSTNPNSLSEFKSYPPAMALFQYFWVKIANNFNEYYLYISYQIVSISIFLTFVENIKEFKKTFIAGAILMLTPLVFFNDFYISIYIDSIVSIFFSFIILNFIKEKEYDKFFIIKIALSLFTLVLLKDVGLFFAIISLLVLIVILIKSKKIKFDKHFYKNNKNVINMIIAFVLIIMFAKISWGILININNVTVSFGNKITIKDIIDLILGNTLPYRKEVIKNFVTSLFTKEILMYPFILDFVKIVIILSIIYVFLYKKKIFNNKAIIITIFSGLFIYAFGLMILYCFKFSEYEAVRLASYSRYLSIYLNCLLFISCVFLIDSKYNIITLIILIIFIPYSSVFRIITTKNETIETRKQYQEVALNIKKYVKPSDKIYVIIQNTTGYDYWHLHHVLRPNPINENYSWSIGEKYYDGDIWTLNISCNEWLENLKQNYDYVYLFKTDDKFIDEFKCAFNNSENIKNGNLFKIDKKLILVN